MSYSIPIGTLPGLVSGYVGQDIEIATLGTASWVTRVFLRQTDYDDSGATDTSVTGSVRDDTGGGGMGIDFVLPDQTQSVHATGLLWIEAAGTIYLRVSAAAGSSMNLTGWIEVEGDAVGVTTALTNLARVKAHANITSGDYDAILSTLILGVSAAMQSYMRRTIVLSTATAEKTESGPGSRIVTFAHYPIVSFTSLTESDAALAEGTDFEANETDLLAGQAVRIAGTSPIQWTSGTRNIVATYVHGYAYVPEDLALAATLQTRQEFLQTKQGGDRVGDTSRSTQSGGVVGYQTAEWLPMVLRLMMPYVRVGM